MECTLKPLVPLSESQLAPSRLHCTWENPNERRDSESETSSPAMHVSESGEQMEFAVTHCGSDAQHASLISPHFVHRFSVEHEKPSVQVPPAQHGWDSPPQVASLELVHFPCKQAKPGLQTSFSQHCWESPPHCWQEPYWLPGGTMQVPLLHLNAGSVMLQILHADGLDEHALQKGAMGFVESQYWFAAHVGHRTGDAHSDAGTHSPALDGSLQHMVAPVHFSLEGPQSCAILQNEPKHCRSFLQAVSGALAEEGQHCCVRPPQAIQTSSNPHFRPEEHLSPSGQHLSPALPQSPFSLSMQTPASSGPPEESQYSVSGLHTGSHPRLFGEGHSSPSMHRLPASVAQQIDVLVQK